VWAFMVAGLLGRRLPGSVHQCFESQRRRRRRDARSSPGRRSASTSGAQLTADGDGSGEEFETKSDVDSKMSHEDRGGRALSDVSTDETMPCVEERAEDAPVQHAAESSEAYKVLLGGRPTHEAVLQVICLTAQLMGKLCGDNMSGDGRMSEGAELALQRETYDLVCHYVAELFGPINRTKMHALAFHLMDELLNRGNLVEADTSVNEALHGQLKAIFEITNKHTTSFAVQMLRCDQTLAHIVAEDTDGKTRAASVLPSASREPVRGAEVGDSFTQKRHHPAARHLPDENENSCTSVDGAAEDADNQADNDGERPAKRSRTAASSGRRRRRRRVRVRGHRVALEDLLTRDGWRLQEIAELLGASNQQHQIVAKSLKFDAVLGWRTERLDQHIRAAPDLYRKPWYDHIVYRDAACPGQPQVGLVRLIVRAVGGTRRDAIIVQRMRTAEPQNGCVLSSFGCRRLKWAVNDKTGFPSLAIVNLIDVERLEHVVPDFEDLCERHGLRGTPTTIPDTPRERLLQRYFFNIFFSWTSNSIDEMPGYGLSSIHEVFPLLLSCSLQSLLSSLISSCRPSCTFEQLPYARTAAGRRRHRRRRGNASWRRCSAGGTISMTASPPPPPRVPPNPWGPHRPPLPGAERSAPARG